MNDLTIRLETQKDYRAVEELTREAFWNVYKPGADEHYYVHMMRSSIFSPPYTQIIKYPDRFFSTLFAKMAQPPPPRRLF